MTNLAKSWKITRGHLANARAAIPDDVNSRDRFSLKRYDEYLDHNELGLAFEELFGIGQEGSYGRDFWLALAAAAENMKLLDDAARCRKQAGKESYVRWSRKVPTVLASLSKLTRLV